jgi:hypothetical protein
MKNTIGFIRVRKRKLSRGWYGGTASASYDIVRAVRVNGEPRHKFVLGLGTQENSNGDWNMVGFWVQAIQRMKKHGIRKASREQFILACVRKGARLPTKAQCESFRAFHSVTARDLGKAEMPELLALIQTSRLRTTGKRGRTSRRRKTFPRACG